MFPLGTVLLPGLVLPLHVFEPRYRQLVTDCLAGDREFGVVLIERGNEVGGGDTRTAVGTVARIVEAVEMPDGRWALGAVGVRRIRVTCWLDDDPYPRAEVEDWPDPQPGTDLADQVAGAVTALRRVLARQSELGQSAAPATVELHEDPVVATYQAIAVSGFGTVDQYDLLAIESPDERVALLLQLLADEDAALQQRLALE